MAINIAYLEVRLSGGAANTNPNLSLGGDVSSERVLSQSHTALSNITGVTIEYAAGNPLGAGSLVYTFVGQTLTWTPNSGSAGAPVPISVTGEYTIKGSTGILLVNVVSGSLPGSNQTDAVTIANIANETFDDVTKTESYDGDSEYRCFYFKNTHPTDPFMDIVAFIQTQPTPGTLAIGKDPAGPGDGVTRTAGGGTLTRSGSLATQVHTAHGYLTGDVVTYSGAAQTEYNGPQTITRLDADTFTFPVAGTPVTPATGTILMKFGVATTIVSEGVAPAGVTFTSPTSEATGVSLGGLGPGRVAAIWERRLIPARNVTTNAASTSLLSFQAYY